MRNRCRITQTGNCVDTEHRAKQSVVFLVVVVRIFIRIFSTEK